MIYHPEKYGIKDEAMKPFIDTGEIWDIIEHAVPAKERVREII